jgi:4'-phosphopantetheinyl transferase EntD
MVVIGANSTGKCARKSPEEPCIIFGVPDSSAAASLFPPAVAFCVSLAPPARPDLHPGEQCFAAGMAPGRLLQFSHGRSCARTALAALGIEACAIGVGTQREPLWPTGITGSITHCEHRAAAAVGRAAHFLGVGLDLEEPGPLAPEIRGMICTPSEAAQLAALPASCGRLLFSAKESVFKCIWPVVQRFVDFPEVEVELQVRDRRFRATSGDRVLGPLVARLEGRYGETGGAWLTTAWISAGAPAPGPITR